MRSKRIYVASSWRNEHQPRVVSTLREIGHEVYDFRRPKDGGPGDIGGPLSAVEQIAERGFHWSEIDERWQSWTPEEYRRHLNDHELCDAGFLQDFNAMSWADTCVLVLPCGRSAHLEAGWFVGQHRRTLIFYPNGVNAEPELMYRFTPIVVGWKELEDEFRCSD